ncbi:hypothetical protein J5N97_019663 [Dioscorea zingiberensis]|uniref:Uncharacterized protein n=1 Tax=Dioscorea zingiberensis TaxID=325984 RepID=A0A9D5HCP9_9LILI|nr:hypothetical protein J5N97_019663 [Dioscorea zingiberensis]
MPGIVVDGVVDNEGSNELNSPHDKENSSLAKSPRAPLSQTGEGGVEASIEQLYENVREMESSGDESLSRHSFCSDADESRIDSELHHLAVGEMEAIEIIEKEVGGANDVPVKKENGSSSRKSDKEANIRSPGSKSSASSKKSKVPSRLQLASDASTKRKPNSKDSVQAGEKAFRKPSIGVNRAKKQIESVSGELKTPDGFEDPLEVGLDNPDLGPFLLKQSRTLMLSGENPQRALKYAIRAAKSFEKCADGKPSLELVMSLHVTAAIHCSLGQYIEAIPVLEKSIEIPILEEGHDHALGKFSGYMQLGDTYAMLGQLDNSIQCYRSGLQIQKQVLGDKDPRVGETCRYLAEAHVQAMQFDEAKSLCQMALDIHRENGAPGSPEEAGDRRLMGLICDNMGNHETALEHLVLASMALMSNGQEAEVASVDCSIGDTYLSLARYDEAIFAYQKALTMFKSTKGENHPAVASVFVRLADLYHKIGKLRESKSYCENALRIYGKLHPGTSSDEIASGFTDIAAIYEAIKEPEEALKLLQKALKIYSYASGHQSSIAGIEAQMGVLYYVTENFVESYNSFKSAITKLRECGEKRSAFFGVALNQMGLVCAHLFAINEAAEMFEEARSILEQEYGPYHPDTLGVCSNLAGVYDAMGRSDEAIEILEYLVGIREEKLGTANPDVDDEKRRLAELLREAGKERNKKIRSLDNLLDSKSHTVKKDEIAT